MSVTKNRINLMWEDVELFARRKSHFMYGQQLTDKQETVYLDALVLLVLTWNDLLPFLEEYDPFWYRRWLNYVNACAVEEFVSVLKYADKILLLSANGQYFAYEAFKQPSESEISYAGAILSPLQREIRYWLEEYEPETLSCLHTCLAFITRLNLPDIDYLSKQAYEDYIQGEDKIQIQGFTSLEKKIIESWFPVPFASDYLFANWYPKHGNGAVADTCNNLLAKYVAFGHDHRTQYLDLRLGEISGRPYQEQKFLRQSKVVFVPKSIDKLRTICEEPSQLMWYQQGFLRSITMYVERHRYLSRRINLEDQGLSQDLAYEGSIDGSFATIDLSSASDSVSWALIKEWTSTSALYNIALCTRSHYCELPDGKVIESKKFAPMGSALCFPLECIIFSAIVEAAITESSGRAYCSDYRVYGDDIIVETSYADAVIKRLEQNGFTINKLKTFSSVGDRIFRESCGGEYYNGVDVTAVRMSRRFAGYSTPNLSASQISGLIVMCNRCYSKLPSVRRRIIARLLELPKHLQPIFDEDGEKGIFSSQPTNFHLNKPRYHRGLQSWRFEHGGLSKPKASVPDNSAFDDIRLFEYLRAVYHRKKLSDPEDRIDPMILPQSKETWTSTKSIIYNATQCSALESGKGTST